PRPDTHVAASALVLRFAALPLSCALKVGFRSRSAACCSRVSSIPRTHALTDDFETPRSSAISLIGAPEVSRRRRASSRSAVFNLVNSVTRLSDRAGGGG